MLELRLGSLGSDIDWFPKQNNPPTMAPKTWLCYFEYNYTASIQVEQVI